MKNRIILITTVLIAVLTNFTVAFAADVSDLFGPESYFHPFISIDQNWSDNIYKTKNNTTGDYWITTKPGIWIAFPGSNTFKPPIDEMSRFQSYLSYNPDITNYLGENDHDDIDHNLEGHLFYNGDGGLSITLSDVFINSHDDIIEGMDNIHYTDNNLSTDIRYEASEKIAFSLGYSLFTENYEKIKNSQDRKENKYESAVYYGLMPKTLVFFQLSFKDIGYDNLIDQDSKETDYLVGLKWDITDRTSGSFKAGYMNKNFKSSSISDTSIMKLELDADYDISARSDISLTIKNEITEAGEVRRIVSPNATYIESTSMLSSYRHELTERVSCFFSIYYKKDDYDINRKDTTINISPSVTYKFNDLFSCDFAYTYEDVDSKGNDSGDIYTANILLLTFSATM